MVKIKGTATWKHWCPKGCGRKCIYNRSENKFICSICKGRFKKEELL
jgi:hypothetical protein